MHPLRIGVTGHRRYDDPDEVAVRIADVAEQLVRRAAGRPVEAWSSLAEGADRVVVDSLARRGAVLVVVLPLAAEDYRTDFATPQSRAAFDEALATASDVTVVDTPMPGTGVSREAAYEAAGRAVVAATDVLVAVWDGAPSRGRGGTAEIVDHARQLGREVIVVPVTRPADG